MGFNARFGGFGSFFLKGRLKVPARTTVDTIPTPPLDSAHLSARGWLSASSAAKAHMHNTAMLDQPACSPLARFLSTARSKASKPAALAV